MDCPICLDVINIDDPKILTCNHRFHKECINQWIQPTCPICRKQIVYTFLNKRESVYLPPIRNLIIELANNDSNYQ